MKGQIGQDVRRFREDLVDEIDSRRSVLGTREPGFTLSAGDLEEDGSSELASLGLPSLVL